MEISRSTRHRGRGSDEVRGISQQETHAAGRSGRVLQHHPRVELPHDERGDSSRVRLLISRERSDLRLALDVVDPSTTIVTLSGRGAVYPRGKAVNAGCVVGGARWCGGGVVAALRQPCGPEVHNRADVASALDDAEINHGGEEKIVGEAVGVEPVVEGVQPSCVDVCGAGCKCAGHMSIDECGRRRAVGTDHPALFLNASV